jgi:predicted RNA-binding Zn ribbon-like protein
VQFNHDNAVRVALAVELVNTWAPDGRAPATLEELLHRHAILRPTVTVGAAQQLDAWSGRLRTVFEAVGVDARCEQINVLLDAAAGRTHLSTHDGRRPHFHWAAEGDTLVSRVKAVTAGGLAVFTVEAEGMRLGVCAREDCTAVFADTSRNGRRAYCSARCGNYAAVHRHRDRRRRPDPSRIRL